ncbi:hypothetical protein CVT26_007042 [Gymnopilus dilepis]|uniref:Uncharacterized protein n=1 Tax=Gymnopilus dilepis TaxID=231916 RepID=A0A409VNB9_9AGAR|nr:hypothetical protein CVT26_007042 [Gymnopilus dilepis]
MARKGIGAKGAPNVGPRGHEISGQKQTTMAWRHCEWFVFPISRYPSHSPLLPFQITYNTPKSSQLAFPRTQAILRISSLVNEPLTTIDLASHKRGADPLRRRPGKVDV